jgi:hypothetical protein
MAAAPLFRVGTCPVCGPGSEVVVLHDGALLFWCSFCENATRSYAATDVNEVAPLPRRAFRHATLDELVQAGVQPFAQASQRANDELRQARFRRE